MRKLIQLAFFQACLWGGIPAVAQIDVSNQGDLYISDGQLVHIEGNFSNFSSGFVNRGDVGLTGNLWNEARVHNSGNGIFRFHGDQEQTLFLYDTTAFYEMEVDNPAGITFAGDHDAEVYSHLHFWDGLVRTNAQSMLFFLPQADYSNADDFSHVDGPMMRRGDSDFIFPVGKGGRMMAPGVSGLSTTNTFLAEYFNFGYATLDTDFTLNRVNDQEYWQVERTEGASTAKVSIPYDVNSGFVNDLEDLRMAYFDEGQDLWTKREALSDGASPMMSLISQDFLTQFGLFTTAENRTYLGDVIEISLVQNEECEIIVNWVVPPDYPVVLYEIERSFDSIEFVKIGEMPGDTFPNIDYTLRWFPDPELYSQDVLYYRMKITFPDGTSYYTNIASIENKCIFVHCQIFPNPVSTHQNLNIRLETEEEQDMTLRIYSVPGRLLLEQTIQVKEGRHDYEIMTKDLELPAAPYFLYVGPRKTLKFIVIND